jgi:DNA replication licensing factor MCM3
VDERDAMAAEEILRFALFKEVLRAERRKRRKLNHGTQEPGDEGTDDDGEGEDEAEPEAVTEGERQRAATRAAAKAKRLEREESEAVRDAEAAARPRRDPVAQPAAGAAGEDDAMAGADATRRGTISVERYVP